MSADPGHVRQRGLTMIELVLFILIVGIAVTGVLQVISLNVGRSADPILRKQALSIAEGLMDEVRGAGFTWCDVNDPNVQLATSAADCTIPEAVGPEANGGLRPFDNVNDYVTQYGAPKAYATDTAGAAYPAGYAATVTVTQADSFGPAGATVPVGAVLRIVVSVAYGRDTVVLESYRTRYAPN